MLCESVEAYVLECSHFTGGTVEVEPWRDVTEECRKRNNVVNMNIYLFYHCSVLYPQCNGVVSIKRYANLMLTSSTLKDYSDMFTHLLKSYAQV